VSIDYKKMEVTKLKEVYQMTDGINKVQITLFPNSTYEIYRIRVHDEDFIEQVKKEIYKLI
jgi:hypothetical protein